ncbi:MAG: bifunctional phosphopantothenoylcysteine decarboxylase/phosphopantothenate--cysteine ligase CoaBC [Gammaproteobacteria bacterium]|nr:bifunctional phosphopantothenoylcysteine decarboxylase/phosphopantothenate--cysteine ligase CoaBC [Gammaproteobacteria bacterium]
MPVARKILLGVSGGIAAYKSPDLVRRLRERGAEVRVVMTDGAQRFITPLTLQAVSGWPVRTDLWDEHAESAMGHIELARWADLIVIAPATADLIARLASGSANDLLGTLCLASEAPLFLAPAMNQQMWSNPATQANCARLQERGITLLGPDAGDQACGEVGPGRMLEPLEIAMRLTSGRALAGRKIVVTAGPTREALDPVRFISNRSSGRMGFAMAQAAAEAGASVILVSGPVYLTAAPGVDRVDVESAEQMSDAVCEALPGADVFIAAAAVSDFQPASFQTRKIKKDGAGISITFKAAPDILAGVTAGQKRPFCVGFAAETDDVEANALAKMKNKDLDMIFANQVGPGLGFEVPVNSLTAYWPGGKKHFATQDKLILARKLVDLIAGRLAGQAN